MLRPLLLFPFFFFLISTDALNAQKKYEGFGASTRGGRGGKIVHVKNLNAKGEGSLHAAMGKNRTIVFDVGGTINNFRWDSSEEFSVTNLTIDGSTAPKPGITLNNNNNGDGLSFQDGCHDIIVNNIRVRNAGNDGFSVVNAHDIVFDHCSSSGNRDGNLDISAGAYNVTVQFCILGNGTSGWSGNMLIGYSPTKNISVHHNLFSSATDGGVGERNPFVRASGSPYSEMMVDFRNNLVWQWGRNAGSGGGYGSGLDYNGTGMFINNYYYSTSEPTRAIDMNADLESGSGAQVYTSGNVSGNAGVTPNSVSNHPPWTIPAAGAVTTQDACTAAIIVKEQAGCQPLDATDQALIKAIVLSNCRGGKNQPPAANAGKDVTLTLPLNSATLTGSGSDPDGKITGYDWTKVSGPLNYTLKNKYSAISNVSNLIQGTYFFSLTVADNRGARATDSIKITVKPAVRRK